MKRKIAKPEAAGGRRKIARCYLRIKKRRNNIPELIKAVSKRPLRKIALRRYAYILRLHGRRLLAQELAAFRKLIAEVQKAEERRLEQTLKSLTEPETKKENCPAFHITKKIKRKARRW